MKIFLPIMAILMAIILAALMIFAGVRFDEEKITAESLAYHGWCKLYNCDQLTIKEWSAMREIGVLPGMPCEELEAK